MPKRYFIPHKHLYSYSVLFLRSLATPSIVYLIIIGNVILLCCAFLFYHLEHPTNATVVHFFDALWWAFSTVTTVGYGDVVPGTTLGRIVSIFLMLSGAVMFFGFTAILISVFASITTEEVKETEKLTKTEYRHVMQAIEALTRKIDKLESSQRNDRF